MHRKIDPLPPGSNVHVIQLHEHLTGDFFGQRLKILAAQISPYIQRGRQRHRRQRLQRQTMPVAVVDDAQLHLIQFQHRRGTHFIVPQQLGVVNLDVALAEQPARNRAIVLFFELQRNTRHGNAATAVAAHGQHRTVNIKRMEIDLQQRCGAP